MKEQKPVPSNTFAERASFLWLGEGTFPVYYRSTVLVVLLYHGCRVHSHAASFYLYMQVWFFCGFHRDGSNSTELLAFGNHIPFLYQEVFS